MHTNLTQYWNASVIVFSEFNILFFFLLVTWEVEQKLSTTFCNNFTAPSKHLCRRCMRSTECPSSLTLKLSENFKRHRLTERQLSFFATNLSWPRLYIVYCLTSVSAVRRRPVLIQFFDMEARQREWLSIGDVKVSEGVAGGGLVRLSRLIGDHTRAAGKRRRRRRSRQLCAVSTQFAERHQRRPNR